MSYDGGWAAIHLDMPRRVPRTEYSAEGHWELLRTVTGIEVADDSPDEVKAAARRAFYDAWDYGLIWSTLIGRGEFGDLCTDMGHGEYAAGGVDRRDTIHCPFTDPEQVLTFDPAEAFGRQEAGELTQRYEQHYRWQVADYGRSVRMTGIYITLMSGLIDLFGWEMLLLAAGTDARRFGELANRYAAWVQQYFDALAAADVPVVMVHDDMVWSSGPFLRPDWYGEFIFPNYRRLFAPLAESGKRILYTCDGDYTQFLDDVAACGVHGFVMEPMTDLAWAAEKYGRTHVLVGNVDTRILLTGTKADIRSEVQRCMVIGKGCPGYFLAVGNHIPANTPVANALHYDQVYRELGARG